MRKPKHTQTKTQNASFKERIDASNKAFKEAIERELSHKSRESKTQKVFHKMLNTNEPVRTDWITGSFDDKVRNQRIAHNKIKTQMRALIRIAKEVIEEVEKTKPNEILLTELVAEEMLELLDEIIITTLGPATTPSRF